MEDYLKGLSIASGEFFASADTAHEELQRIKERERSGARKQAAAKRQRTKKQQARVSFIERMQDPAEKQKYENRKAGQLRARTTARLRSDERDAERLGMHLVDYHIMQEVRRIRAITGKRIQQELVEEWSHLTANGREPTLDELEVFPLTCDQPEMDASVIDISVPEIKAAFRLRGDLMTREYYANKEAQDASI